jgi:hypothetical protein
MSKYKGEYVTAEATWSLMTIENASGSISAALTRDEALDLREAIGAVIGAMPVDIGTDIPGRQATRAAMDRADTAAYAGDPYRGR